MTISRSICRLYFVYIVALLIVSLPTFTTAGAATHTVQRSSATNQTSSAVKQSKPKSADSADDDDDEDEEEKSTTTEKVSATTKQNRDKSSSRVEGQDSECWKKDSNRAGSKTALPNSFYTDPSYNSMILEKVDKVVSKRLYSKTLADTTWKTAVLKQRKEILGSKNLKELQSSLSAAIAELKSSHCNFVTTNDEMYHFLHSLFADFNKKMDRGKTDYVGFVAGGKPFADNQVRYVLDGSPAAQAGLEIGDLILKVDGLKYVGYSHFLGMSGKSVTMEIDRKGSTRTVTLKPEKAELYAAYVKAMHDSVRVIEVGGKKLGYVHVWCGGGKSHNALEEIMEDKLAETDGLILDIRDGYGGNSLTDLDRFYRTRSGFPDFVTVDRKGKKTVGREYYEKPMVAIINGGSRSGKELVAFSLKRTGRAKLVGTTTAGAVLAGSLRPVDGRASVYIAVLDGTVDGVRLEGTGVAPDIEIDNGSHDKVGYDQQLSAAQKALIDLMNVQTKG